MYLPNIELAELRYFYAVATAGSFAEGARQAHVSAPAVSKAIKKLEHALGAEVFDRSGRRVALTPAGEVLVEHAKGVLEAMSALSSAVDDVQGTVAGDIHVACTEEFAARALPMAIVAVAQAHPKLCVRTYLMGPDEIGRRLTDGDLDLGLVPGRRFVADHLVAIPLTESPASIVCGRHHPLYGERSVALDTMLEHAFVVPEFFGHGVPRDGWPADAPPRKLGATVELVQMAIQIVAEGRLLGCFPDVMIRCELNHDELSRIDGGIAVPATELVAVRRADGPRRTAVRTLLDAVKVALADALSSECAI